MYMVHGPKGASAGYTVVVAFSPNERTYSTTMSIISHHQVN